MDLTDIRLCVTVLSGLSGSGKTTLLKHLLAKLGRKRLAVIENGYGGIATGHHLVLRTGAGELETGTGCTCSGGAEEGFLRLMHRIAEMKHNYDHLIVETAGTAHPGMVARAVSGDPFLQKHLEVDGVCTVVDAKTILDHLGKDDHADGQVAGANLLVINKIDLVSPVELRWVKDALTGLNPDCERAYAEDARVPAWQVLGIGRKLVPSRLEGCPA